MPENQNPFGPSQTALFQYILTHQPCTFKAIWDAEFPDKHSRYLYNLLRENSALIERTPAANDQYPDEYRMRIHSLGGIVDVQHWVRTGQFKRVYKQTELFTQTQA